MRFHPTGIGSRSIGPTARLYYGIGALCLCGLVIQIGRQTQARRGQTFPVLLWITILVLAARHGFSLADLVIAPIVAEVYEFDFQQKAGKVVLSIAIGLLWLLALERLAQLRSAWRKFVMTMLMIGAVLILGVALYFIVRIDQAGVGASTPVPFVMEGGFRGTIKLGWVLYGLMPMLFLMDLTLWWALFRKKTRQLFRERLPASSCAA